MPFGGIVTCIRDIIKQCFRAFCACCACSDNDNRHQKGGEHVTRAKTHTNTRRSIDVPSQMCNYFGVSESAPLKKQATTQTSLEDITANINHEESTSTESKTLRTSETTIISRSRSRSFDTSTCTHSTDVRNKKVLIIPTARQRQMKSDLRRSLSFPGVNDAETVGHGRVGILTSFNDQG